LGYKKEGKNPLKVRCNWHWKEQKEKKKKMRTVKGKGEKMYDPEKVGNSCASAKHAVVLILRSLYWKKRGSPPE